MTLQVTSQMRTAPFDQETLRELAGARSFERGSEYFIGGQVLRFTDHGDCVEGLVLGTRAYRVGLSCQDEGVSFNCDCPVGQADRFCKHVVALGLSWREGIAEVRKIEACDRLFERAVNSLRLDESLFADDEWHEVATTMLDDLLRSERATEALAVIEGAMNKIAEARGLEIEAGCCDGEWEQMEELLCECHVEAAHCAVKGAEFAARRVLDWELRQTGAGFNPESIGVTLSGKYEEAFGKDWLTAYRSLIEEHWRKLRQTGDEQPTFLNLARRRQLIWLERKLRERTEQTQGCEPYNQSNESVEQLWREFTASPSLCCFERLRESALSLGNWLEWRARVFEYLRRRAAKTGNSSTAKKRSCMLAGNDADNSDLVRIWLAEGEAEEAYQAARDGDCADDLWLKLAALRIRTDPASSLVIYKRTIRKLLGRKDRYSAERAGKLLRKARRLMKRLDSEEEYKGFVAELRRAYGSQRNFARAIAGVTAK